MRLSAENFAAVQTLTTALVLSLTRPRGQGSRHRGRAAPRPATAGCCGASASRATGPIVLVSAGAMQGLGLLRSLVQALRLWAWGGVACDLVVVNAEPASYLMALQRELVALRERHVAGSDAESSPAARQPAASTCCAPTSSRADELSTLQRAGAGAAARRRPPAAAPRAGMDGAARAGLRGAARRPRPRRSPGRRASRRGACAHDGRLRPRPRANSASRSARGLRPARPWINVLANPASARRSPKPAAATPGPCNSRLNQLTAWSNDPRGRPAGGVVPAAGPQDPRGVERGAVGLGRLAAWPTASRTARATASSATAAATLEVTASWCVDAQSSRQAGAAAARQPRQPRRCSCARSASPSG